MRQSIQFIAILLLISVAALSFAAPAQNVAIVYKTKGSVEYFKAGAKTSTALASGQHLNHGDRIKTGADGYVFLLFVEDKTQIKVRENTDLTISADRGSAGLEQQVNVDIGKIWTHVTKEGSKLRVGTPTSVASVKGTMWWTLVDQNGNTQIIGLQGLIALLCRATGQTGEVGAGLTGEVTGSGLNIFQTRGGIPNPEGTGRTHTIRIPFIDGDGNQRTLIVEFEEL